MHSFDHRLVRRLGARDPGLRRGILLSAYLADPVSAMEAAGASTLWQEWHYVDDELVRTVHAAGRALVAWTVNELADLRRLTRLGVDGLCGNYPDRIRVAIGLAAGVESPGSRARLRRRPLPAAAPSRAPRPRALTSGDPLL